MPWVPRFLLSPLLCRIWAQCLYAPFFWTSSSVFLQRVSYGSLEAVFCPCHLSLLLSSVLFLFPVCLCSRRFSLCPVTGALLKSGDSYVLVFVEEALKDRLLFRGRLWFVNCPGHGVVGQAGPSHRQDLCLSRDVTCLGAAVSGLGMKVMTRPSARVSETEDRSS